MIVTSRASNFPAYIPTLELGALGEDEATEFLVERTQGQARPSRPTTQLERASSRGSLAAWRSAWSRPAPISHRQRIGFARYLALWRGKRDGDAETIR